MTLAERIKKAQTEHTTLSDQLFEATKALDSAAEDDESAIIQVETLTGQVEKSNRELDTLVKAEKALAEHVVEKSHTDPDPDTRLPRIIPGAKGGDASPLWLKRAVCKYLAHVQRREFDSVVEERYARDKAFKAVNDYHTKSAVPQATTYNVGWAAELVRDDIQGFIDVLTPTSAAAALANQAVLLSFDGFNSITMPRRSARNKTNNYMGGAFVGEGGAIPLGRMVLAAQKLERYKMGVISTFSKELAERSTPAIEAVVRQAILDDMSIELDAAVFGNQAQVAGVKPAGLLNGVTLNTGTAGGGSDAVIADFKAMVMDLVNAGLGTKPVLIMNSGDVLSLGLVTNAMGELMFKSDVAGGNLLAVPFIKSLNIPAGTAYLVDAAVVATGFDPVDFDVSDVATVVEADANLTAPTHDGLGGTIGTRPNEVPRQGGIPADVPAVGAQYVGAQARSLWQTYSIGVRSVWPVSWGVIQPGGVTGVEDITW